MDRRYTKTRTVPGIGRVRVAFVENHVKELLKQTKPKILFLSTDVNNEASLILYNKEIIIIYSWTPQTYEKGNVRMITDYYYLDIESIPTNADAPFNINDFHEVLLNNRSPNALPLSRASFFNLMKVE